MKTKLSVAILFAFVFSSVPNPNSSAYSICGFHDHRFSMTAYHWNSEFWVDMLVSEAGKWNSVHNTLSIGRTRSSTINVGKDGRNVIGWISESSLNRYYGLSWSGTVGWTITWNNGTCGEIVEADMFFNPGITLFTQQTLVPYNLGYQEIALHELGHALTLDHEDGSLAVMTSGSAVSNILHHNDKVGWLRSADFRFGVTDRSDMGIFPLRNDGAGKIYCTLSPLSVVRGNNITIENITVENLSSGMSFSNPAFDVRLENTATSSAINIGSFSWGSFGAFSQWSGNLTFRVPSSTPAGSYRVVIEFKGSDSDADNNKSVLGTISVRN